MNDYGIAISKSGVDVKTANPDEFLFNSSYFNFKVFATGSGSITSGVATSLANNINDTQTTIEVNDISEYSESGIFVVYDGTNVEYISYTSRNVSANEFTNCTRGALGTSPKSFSSGDDVRAALTRESIFTHNLGYHPVIFTWSKRSGESIWRPSSSLKIIGSLDNQREKITHVAKTNVLEIVFRSYAQGGFALWPGNITYDIQYQVMYDKVRS